MEDGLDGKRVNFGRRVKNLMYTEENKLSSVLNLFFYEKYGVIIIYR